MSPPRSLVNLCHWLFAHPLGWLVLDLVLWIAFIVASFSLTAVDAWYVPMPVHNTVLMVLTLGFMVPFLALLARRSAQNVSDEIARATTWLDRRIGERVESAVDRIRENQPTQPLPVRFTARAATNESIVPSARSRFGHKGGRLNSERVIGLLEGVLAAQEDSGEFPFVREEEL